MKFKYVNPKSVERFIGKYCPIDYFYFARIIEETLINTNLGYVHTEANRGGIKSDPPYISERLLGVSDKLLKHNLSRKKHPWDFYSGLDFDLVHEADHKNMLNGKSINTTVKAYFHQKDCSRESKDIRVVFHFSFNSYGGSQWEISFPVQIVMKGYQFIENSYFGYCHGITLLGEDRKPITTQKNYVGITKRSWLKRMSEHIYEVESGSNKKFHSAWREFKGNKDVLYTSELIVLNQDYEQVMKWEEYIVDQQMALGTSLNMIPGGFKGIRFLYEHKIITSNKPPLEERDLALEKYAFNHQPIIPNILISNLWKNPDYAERVICGWEGRLTVEQVREIRRLNIQGRTASEIVENINAKNELQVERVISGITYSRIS
ncbi:hypothetical protein [Rahnella aquatilis]|uniref:hypothetical protein n=1 Tax=Rahnella aquatilis TaxID=34038 RepID=UPI000647D870|nr:hypothetical protein [Rahnella aquatilis]